MGEVTSRESVRHRDSSYVGTDTHLAQQNFRVEELDLPDESTLVAESSAQPDSLRFQNIERSFYASHGKRLFDFSAALVLIFLLSPVFILVALLVRTQIGPSIIFRQSRVGLHGKPFEILKFRSMLPDQRKSAVPVNVDRRVNGHKTLADPRHTALGLKLRSVGWDELPQLFNVLRGDMSFVGPRPELVEVAKARGYLQHGRHSVRPGIIGPYQLSALRQDGDLTKGFEMDLEYARNVRFFSDLLLLGKTPLVLFTSTSNR